MSLSSLSSYRLRKTASGVGEIKFSDAKHFTVLKSDVTSPITQYYIISTDWDETDRKSRVEPLAQFCVDEKTGTVTPYSYQPEKFDIKASLSAVMEMFNQALDSRAERYQRIH